MMSPKIKKKEKTFMPDNIHQDYFSLIESEVLV